MFTKAVHRVLGSRLAAALATPHGVDAYLAQVDPRWSLSEVRAGIVELRRETADAVTLVLAPNRNWRGYRAGQHVAFTATIDGVRHTRVFSLSSSPRRADRRIEVTIKRHPGGLVSRWAVERARPGDVVVLSQATGDFTVPAPAPRRILLVSGGSGITPCMAILRTLCADGQSGRVTFVHYARTAADVIFAAELRALAAAHPLLDLRIELTETTTPAPLLDRARLLALCPDVASCAAYVCGPPPLAAAAVAAWTSLGLRDRLQLETFAPPGATVAAITATADAPIRATLTLARSSRTLAADQRPLLPQIEAAGLSPPSGCRMGICGTCRCRKSSGTVRDLRTGRLSSEPDVDIALCVSAPVGDVTLDL